MRNDGQYPSEVHFTGRFGAATVWVRGDDLVLRTVADPLSAGNVENVYLRFPGAQFTEITGEDPTGAVYNILKGRDRDGWIRGIPVFRRVRIRDIHEGIDLVLDAESRHGTPWYMELTSADADPNAVTLEVDGQGVVAIGEDRIEVAGSGSALDIPALGLVRGGTFLGTGIWDEHGNIIGTRTPEAGRTELTQEFLWGTYLGGSGLDHPTTAVPASDGDVVVTGITGSQNLPAPQGYQQSYGGGLRDMFLARFSGDGNSLRWGTFIGGTGEDNAHSLALDRQGNIVVGGDTQSDDIPVPNGYDTIRSSFDGYIAKVAPSGDDILWGTFVGGSGSDFYVSSEFTPYGLSLILDPDDAVLFTGWGGSGIPVPNGYDTTFNGQGDIYVGKLSENGDALLWGTYIGGSGDDKAAAIRRDPSGDLVVLGLTRSTDMPTPNGFDSTLNGPESQGDFYVAKLSGDGGTLRWGTYLGGGEWDYPVDLLVDGASEVIVSGHTRSGDMPSVGGFQPDTGGDYDLYIAKLSSSGSSVLWSTYYGGSKMDQFPLMTNDREGNILVAARSLSLGLATPEGYDFFNHGEGDMLLLKLSSNGNQREWASYFGGGNADSPTFVLYGEEDRILLGGITYTQNLATDGAYDVTHNGQADAYLGAFDDPSFFPCTLSCTVTVLPDSGRAPLAVRFSAAAEAASCNADPVYAWDFGDGQISSEVAPLHTFDTPGEYGWTVTVTVEDQSCTRSGTVTVTPSKPGDGDGDGIVTIGEVQQVINMFLGISPPGNYADCDKDGALSIGEVQKVINAFLGLAVDC